MRPITLRSSERAFPLQQLVRPGGNPRRLALNRWVAEYRNPTYAAIKLAPAGSVATSSNFKGLAKLKFVVDSKSE